ncbi:type II/IV secretion system protein [Patescibacteria group bacterium]|nr:MAG: type II/IV secretion system protein [Patescibacteria group bacterium]
MLDIRLTRLLRHSTIIPASALRKTAAQAEKEHTLLGPLLVKSGLVSEEALYRELARLVNLPFIDLTSKVVRKDVLFLIPEPIAASHSVIPFDQTDKEVLIATTDPEDLQTFEFIRRRAGLPVKVHLTTPAGIATVLKSYRRSLTAEFEELTTGAAKGKPAEEKDLKQLAEDIPIVRIVDSLLEHATYENASDIHIEPAEEALAIRYRIDGVLRQVMTLPKAAQDGVLARIKILANLKLDEHRLPQDGRFKVQSPDYRYSIRVSILPVYDGEKVVMRLLAESAKALTLEELGLLNSPRELVERAVTRPHGIIYATGPTGSGKTTTLYSLLGILNKPGVNIVTVEDPIEYRMAGVNQSQVAPRIGYTFANGLRSILRQDPNIIMVGEIRDNETADIAANSALTGHLVLSTLHTNDAPSAITRLDDLGVAPFLVAFTTNLIIAQRLVRKVCKDCSTNYKITAAELEELDRRVGGSAELFRDLVRAKELSASARLNSLMLARGVGCSKCNQEGYRGRIGIYEILEVTPALAALIAKRAGVDELKRQAHADGMLTMFHDGVVKAARGLTSLAEVFRVTKD